MLDYLFINEKFFLLSGMDKFTCVYVHKVLSYIIIELFDRSGRYATSFCVFCGPGVYKDVLHKGN